jgi:hypothetical protein
VLCPCASPNVESTDSLSKQHLLKYRRLARPALTHRNAEYRVVITRNLNGCDFPNQSVLRAAKLIEMIAGGFLAQTLIFLPILLASETHIFLLCLDFG